MHLQGSQMHESGKNLNVSAYFYPLQVRMLASGLVENTSITHLNISHNKVRAGLAAREVNI